MTRTALILALAAFAAARALAEPQGAALDIVFDRLDADGDGSISNAEMTDAKTHQFQRADRNGDGQLTAAERAAVQARLDRAKAAMDAGADRLDSNGDGTLSLAEFTARAPMFALLDIDGDGAVSRAEADRALNILQP